MPWTLVLNPVAGRGHTRDLAPALRAAVARAAFDAEVVVSASAADAEALARKAADAGRDLIAAGGDGTVGLLAGVAADTGCRLGIVPTGSGNDFAAALGYDRKRPLDAIAAIAGGRDATVDLGVVNGRWYTCVTCSGFDAEANRWANTVTRLTGTTLYVAAVLRTLAVYRPNPFRVTVDGTVHETPAWMVAVGNSRAYAGGMQIVPDARMDDGLLDVCVIGNLSRSQLLRHFPKVFRGAHLSVPGVETYRGSRITVEALGSDTMEVWADGERVGPLPATMEPRPGALRVRVPLSSPIDSVRT
ncbi:MAG: diacylglycerol kinase [Actinomycetota bacterium]|jgi:diacylglycerol kinase (ATP)|nr:diacylglycerol kinase [Actinomycetota bacterium]